MRKAGGVPVLVVSAFGYPLCQVVVRRFGRSGAFVVEAVACGLAVRDAALVQAGVPARLGPWPARLLRLELVAAAVATVSGLPAVVDNQRWHETACRRPGSVEIARRVGLAVLFGLHTTRFWIYLQPDQGLRSPPTRHEPTPA